MGPGGTTFSLRDCGRLAVKGALPRSGRGLTRFREVRVPRAVARRGFATSVVTVSLLAAPAVAYGISPVLRDHKTAVVEGGGHEAARDWARSRRHRVE